MTIDDFTDLYQKTVEDNKLLAPFLSGHLAVEFLLRKLVQIYDPALSDFADSLTHAKLIRLNYDIGTISDSAREVLVLINTMRNNFVHQLTFEPSLADLKNLFIKASRAFEDLTDGIAQGLDEINSATGVKDLDEWVISELFIQISYDLHYEYQSRGGDIEDF